MSFSKTTEYTFRILSFMVNDEKKMNKSEEIYKNLKIPYRYLRKLLTQLSKSGLIVSIQGKGGGYKISKDLYKISLFDIVQITEHNQIQHRCFFGFNECLLETK